MIKSFPFVALSALALVACNQISEDDIEIVKVKKQLDKEYSASFTETFGYIDPEQTWGFDVDYSALPASAALTRSIDVNGNQWPYEGFVAPTNITAEEVEKVKAEFAKQRINARNTTYIPFTDFYIQHVYKGDSVYVDGYGNSIGVASDKMDHLDIYDGNIVTWEGITGGYDHVNNFNAGNNNTEYFTDDTYARYFGTTLVTNVKMHEAPDSLFRYYNSVESGAHYEYIILQIDGDYYLGFDFYANGESVQTKFSFETSDYGWQTFYVNGYYKSVEEAQAAGAVATAWAWYWDSEANEGKSVELNYNVGENGNWYHAGYERANQYVERDWVFDDWIIKIVGAAASDDDDDDDDEEEGEGVMNRIMCEDLGSIGDFDFNDVVFDVEFVDGNAHIILRAAGGTMPLYIQGEGQVGVRYEVHDQFGVDVKTMVNTGNGTVTKDPVEIWLNGITSVDQIQVWVTNTKTDTQATYEVGANKGEAPQKINVPSTVAWSKERVNIQKTYPKFETWVGDSTKHFWE